MEKLFDYYLQEDSKFTVSQMQVDILNKYSIGRLTIPSPKQSKILYQLYNVALEEGFVF
jgi:hypothetical protein